MRGRGRGAPRGMARAASMRTSHAEVCLFFFQNTKKNLQINSISFLYFVRNCQMFQNL